MITKSYVGSDGIKRSVDMKQFGDEMRIYRIFGDITDKEALKELAQIISIEYNTPKINIRF